MKNILMLLALAATLTFGSCIGSNNAFRTVHSWNSRATESKWWNELIHAGLWIVPVYELTLFGDIVLFNSIEFWGSGNPISEPEAFKKVNEPQPK